MEADLLAQQPAAEVRNNEEPNGGRVCPDDTLRLWGLSRLWMDAQTRLFLFVPCRSVRGDLDGEKIQKLRISCCIM